LKDVEARLREAKAPGQKIVVDEAIPHTGHFPTRIDRKNLPEEKKGPVHYEAGGRSWDVVLHDEAHIYEYAESSLQAQMGNS
jgi:hypothetical protein